LREWPEGDINLLSSTLAYWWGVSFERVARRWHKPSELYLSVLSYCRQKFAISFT